MTWPENDADWIELVTETWLKGRGLGSGKGRSIDVKKFARSQHGLAGTGKREFIGLLLAEFFILLAKSGGLRSQKL